MSLDSNGMRWNSDTFTCLKEDRVYSVVFDRKSFVNDVGNEWVDGWMIGKFVN